jgi:hypothetical protein
MTKKETSQSELLSAAHEFDSELTRFSRLTEAARRGNLDSQKSLERAAQALQEVANCEEQLSARAQTLMTALAAARDQQQTQAELVQQRAHEIQGRTQEFSDLMKHYQALGADAAELNALGQRLSPGKRDAAAMAADKELLSGLRDLHQRMSRVAESAQELTERAKAARFEDISRQADSLRQQLLSARNKLSLLQRSLGVTPEN